MDKTLYNVISKESIDINDLDEEENYIAHVLIILGYLKRVDGYTYKINPYRMTELLLKYG
jgi:hypothetical protein